jgi:hypothetical protein
MMLCDLPKVIQFKGEQNTANQGSKPPILLASSLKDFRRFV